MTTALQARHAGPFVLLLIVIVFAGCRNDEPARVERPNLNQEAIYGDDMLANGRVTYENFCASCHGEAGLGDGPVAPALKSKPLDLTALRERHGGSFSPDSVYAYIDGRRSISAHGTRTMPVWGNVWSLRSEEAVIDVRIRELVEYIRSIQKDSTAASS